MKLSASNIGWAAENDEQVWQLLKDLGYQGIEIAPTRVIPENPYDCPAGAALFAGVMHQKYGFAVPSMQSIWFGKTGNIFNPDEAKELEEYKLERAELAIALPPDWKLDEESLKDERWYWPIGLLKVLARLPISGDTWLGFGHTMDKQSPFAENTTLCGALLVGPQDVVWNGGEVCTLPSGEEVNFYQVIPLYRNEIEYKMEHDADALLEKMAGISFVVNPTRQNAITRGTLAEEEFTDDITI